MLGNQSSNKPMFRNARLFPHQGNNCNNFKNEHHHSDFIDEDFSNDIPEMKILPMDYVAKTKSKPKCPPPPPPKNFQSKCKFSPSVAAPTNQPPKPPLKVTINAPEKVVKSKQQSDKYLVYKRKHSIFGTSKDSTGEKLKYVSDNDKKSSLEAAVLQAKEKKKYLIFDSKKSSSKLDSIQYYFDNKSYEKHVDNKLYENKLSQQQQKQNKEIADEEDSDCDTSKDFEKVSRSWEYRDNAKTESKLKLFESKHDAQKSKHTNSLSSSKSEDSGASSCSEVSLKRQNCRLKPHQKFTTSKSIGDLTSSSSSSKTSHDVKRINQIFENAKQHQAAVIALKSNNFERDKYKIHKKVKDAEIGKQKYHRSSTDLNIKATALSSCSSSTSSSSSSAASCGFKNCKLSNCPISHTSPPSALSSSNSSLTPSSNSSNVLSMNERRSKFDENFIRKFEGMRKNSPNVILKNNEITVNNKTNISVNGKSNIIVNDMKSNNFTPSSDVFFVNEKESKSRNNGCGGNNDNNKTTIKINESCFVVNHSSGTNNDMKINNNERNKNIIELNSERAISNWDKNIRVKNNPQPKFNNKIDVNNKIKNEENSVKIYVIGSDTAASSPTPSAALSSLTSSSHESSDSDKDDGYYDASSQGRSSSPEFSEMFKKLRDLCSMKAKSSSQIGCDSTLFWNNSFFDEDESDLMLTALNRKTNKSAKSSSSSYACTKCHTTTEDLMSNYICICRNKVKN